MLSGRKATSEEVLEQKIKNSRLSGIVVNDKDVIEGMDRDVSGRFINVTYDKKSGGFKGDLLTAAELGRLKTEIDGILREMANSLKAGNVEVLPCEKQTTAMCVPIAIIMPFADLSRALPSEK